MLRVSGTDARLLEIFESQMTKYLRHFVNRRECKYREAMHTKSEKSKRGEMSVQKDGSTVEGCSKICNSQSQWICSGWLKGAWARCRPDWSLECTLSGEMEGK